MPNKKWEAHTIFVKHFEAICGYFFNFENIVYRSVNWRCKWSTLLAAFVDSADNYYFMFGYSEMQLYGLKPVFIVSSEFSSDWNIHQSITWSVQVLTSLLFIRRMSLPMSERMSSSKSSSESSNCLERDKEEDPNKVEFHFLRTGI